MWVEPMGFGLDQRLGENLRGTARHDLTLGQMSMRFASSVMDCACGQRSGQAETGLPLKREGFPATTKKLSVEASV
ncbi:hypothetical protein FNV43_RR02680 [Rhamnella rubrinervis]|uniref:Uncharacterized protein n=1 Tax=Rhamnella rubrinervis TaxID=2594499 RepID=A0A8K0MTE6_9ROSA|nr:hypothetical protein FNV43_RR02680 [Rhamnella rubrinervis]